MQERAPEAVVTLQRTTPGPATTFWLRAARLSPVHERFVRRLQPLGARLRRLPRPIVIAGGGLALAHAMLVALGLASLAWSAVALIVALAALAGSHMWTAADRARMSTVLADRLDHPTEELAAVTEATALSPAPDIASDLVAALPDPVIVTDAAGSILHLNERVVFLFPKARLGQPVSHLSRNPEFLDAVDTVLSRGRLSVELEERIPVRRRLTAVLVPIAAEPAAGAPAIVIVFRDTSETERLAQMRADFIANASHELRTPLSSLKGFVETLQGPARDDPAARDRFLSIMATQASRMTRLIDDLLSLSRVEMRAHLPPSGTVELYQLAGFVAQSLEPVAVAAEVVIKLAPFDGRAVVRGDREELVQVLQNLVHNAIKYGRKGGHVDISFARRVAQGSGTPQIAVTVADDGPGIAEEHLPRLTERFYRVNAIVSRDKGGTGLGLAIVKNILNRHRGELEIRSELGLGSSFTFVLDKLTGQK